MAFSGKGEVWWITAWRSGATSTASHPLPGRPGPADPSTWCRPCHWAWGSCSPQSECQSCRPAGGRTPTTLQEYFNLFGWKKLLNILICLPVSEPEKEAKPYTFQEYTAAVSKDLGARHISKTWCRTVGHTFHLWAYHIRFLLKYSGSWKIHFWSAGCTYQWTYWIYSHLFGLFYLCLAYLQLPLLDCLQLHWDYYFSSCLPSRN